MRFKASFAATALSLAFAASAAAEDSELPRLTGIVVGPSKRLAIFNDRKNERTSFSVEEGGEIAGFRILTVQPDAVILEGPSGTARLELEQDVRAVTWRAAPAPDFSNLRAQTAKNGEGIAMLALQRDRCARAGLLADAAPNAMEKLHSLIVAISVLPPLEGGAARDAPRRIAASALGAGAEAAQQRPVLDLDADACAKVNASWRAQAGHYGLPND